MVKEATGGNIWLWHTNFLITLKQHESLANAEESARQRYVYEGP